MGLRSELRAFEMRHIRATFCAGALDIGLRFLLHEKYPSISVLGFFGCSLIAYSIFHYAQLARSTHGPGQKRK
jgi:hypothetical protein